MTSTIKVSKSALFEMVMAAFEAYAVKHDGKKIVSIETYAELWGKINKQHPFMCSIEHVSVDTSAKKERGGVTPNGLSLEIKKDIASVFGEGYQHIGSFHTHPWLKDEECVPNVLGDMLLVENANSIRKYNLFNFSNADHACEVGNPMITIAKKEYSVALVMTIHATDKTNDVKDGRIESNLFEFSLGNIKLWLKAQVFEHKLTSTLTDEDKKSLDIYRLTKHKSFNLKAFTQPIPIETNLECAFLEDFGYYLKGFGRLTINSANSEYRNTSSAEKRWFA
jgi:hypothetical protein